MCTKVCIYRLNNYFFLKFHYLRKKFPNFNYFRNFVFFMLSVDSDFNQESGVPAKLQPGISVPEYRYRSDREGWTGSGGGSRTYNPFLYRPFWDWWGTGWKSWKIIVGFICKISFKFNPESGNQVRGRLSRVSSRRANFMVHSALIRGQVRAHISGVPVKVNNILIFYLQVGLNHWF